MKVLNEDQVAALVAFLDAFDLTAHGLWADIEDVMQEEYGILDPEAALADAREALS